MKMKMHLLVAIVAGFIAFTSAAQTSTGSNGSSGSGSTTTAVPAPVFDFGNEAPLVPLNVVTAGGRQSVATYLLGQTMTVNMDMTGASLVGPQGGNYWFDDTSLKQNGYTNRESFGELRGFISQLSVSGNAVKTPGGWYDVRLNFECRNSANRVCIKGGGWFNLNERPDGSLSASTVDTYVWLPEAVGVMFNQYVAAARWLGSQGEVEDLPVDHLDEQSKVTIAEKMFDDGMIVISTYNPEKGWGVRSYNLSSGAVVEGKQFIAALGKSMSSEFLEVSNLSEVMSGDQYRFYRNGDHTFGRFPTVEFKLTQTSSVNPTFRVPIWGTGQSMLPDSIIVRVISSPSYTKGQEFNIPVGYSVTLPPGKYQIRSRYPGIMDWLLDYNAKG